MSFSASNNRILVQDGSATVFDTNDDMPHILATGSYSVTVDFPHTTGRSVMTAYDPCGYTIQEYRCTYEYQNVCSQVYVCNQVYVCSPSYQCQYDYFSGAYVCGFVDSCSYQQQCGYETQCSMQYVQVCNFVPVCQPVAYYAWQYDAKEWVQTYVLGDLPSGIDCNFVLVKAQANRQSTGGTNYFGDLQATVGGETFAFQGSALLEAGGRSNGTRYLSRIISVYPDNASKKLVLEARHSNGAVDPPAGDNSNERSLASRFSITLDVYFGRFR